MKNLTLIPFDLPGKIYRCPLPYGCFDYCSTTLEEMKTNGIKKVVTLVEEVEWWHRAGIDLPSIYKVNGIEMLHLPVVDFEVPKDRDVYLTEVGKVLSWVSNGDNIAVHCFAGIGRTGTFLSTMAIVRFGWNPLDAILWIRQFIPGAVENETQFQFVMEAFQK
jgi:protein-tyrosine phosphatase